MNIKENSHTILCGILKDRSKEFTYRLEFHVKKSVDGVDVISVAQFKVTLSGDKDISAEYLAITRNISRGTELEWQLIFAQIPPVHSIH